MLRDAKRDLDSGTVCPTADLRSMAAILFAYRRDAASSAPMRAQLLAPFRFSFPDAAPDRTMRSAFYSRPRLSLP